MNAFLRMFALLVFLTFTSNLHAQKGKPFPTVNTEMLSGKEMVFPALFAGKYVFVGIGTSKKAEKDLRTWQIPVYNKFIAKTGLMDAMYSVEVAFLPLFTGASQVAKNQIVKELRANNESLVADNLYIYSGSRSPFSEIGVDDRSEPFFFLLDGQGRILWSAQGSFKQEYLDELDTILSK